MTWICRCGRTCSEVTGAVEDVFLIVTCECGQRWQLVAHAPLSWFPWRLVLVGQDEANRRRS